MGVYFPPKNDFGEWTRYNSLSFFETSNRLQKSLQVYNQWFCAPLFSLWECLARLHHLHYKWRKNTALTRVPGIHVGELLLQGWELKLLLEVLLWHPEVDGRQNSRTSGSYYPDNNVSTEPLREDEAVREVEGYHEPHNESDSCSDAGLIIDAGQPDSSRSPSPPRTLVQWCTTKLLVSTKVWSIKLLQRSRNSST